MASVKKRKRPSGKSPENGKQSRVVKHVAKGSEGGGDDTTNGADAPRGGKRTWTQIPWEDRILALEQFVEQNGHSRVPQRWLGTGQRGEHHLGMWVSEMRQLRKKLRLPDEKRQKLDELGFVWNGKPNQGKPLAFIKNAVRSARRGEENCILWPFGKSRGYGSLFYKGRNRRAHRVALTMYSDENPSDLLCTHGPCHDRSCINPLHLGWATHGENHRDKVRDGTNNSGEKHGLAKLTETAVVSIRERYACGRISQAALGREFGVSPSTIYLIVNGKTWTHLI